MAFPHLTKLYTTGLPLLKLAGLNIGSKKNLLAALIRFRNIVLDCVYVKQHGNPCEYKNNSTINHNQQPATSNQQRANKQ
jgi:hypothetical protein